MTTPTRLFRAGDFCTLIKPLLNGWKGHVFVVEDQKRSDDLVRFRKAGVIGEGTRYYCCSDELRLTRAVEDIRGGAPSTTLSTPPATPAPS